MKLLSQPTFCAFCGGEEASHIWIFLQTRGLPKTQRHSCSSKRALAIIIIIIAARLDLTFLRQASGASCVSWLFLLLLSPGLFSLLSFLLSRENEGGGSNCAAEYLNVLGISKKGRRSSTPSFFSGCLCLMTMTSSGKEKKGRREIPLLMFLAFPRRRILDAHKT